MTENSFDTAIVGGGISGVLTAIRLKALNPDHTIAIIEKDEYLGGRSRTGDQEAAIWSYGQSLVSDRFRNFIEENLDSLASLSDWDKDLLKEVDTSKVLMQSNLKDIPLKELFLESGIQILGGSAALTEWKVWESKSSPSEPKENAQQPKSLAKELSLPRKGALAAILNIVAPLLGITEIWECDIEALKERIATFSEKIWRGDWSVLFLAIQKELGQKKIPIFLKNQVLSCERTDKEWQLTCEKNVLNCKNLVIAHNPWDCLSWFSKKLLPTPLVGLVSRAKPASLVTLSTTLSDIKKDFPQLAFIAAEKTVAHLENSGQLIFQAPIDYEKSLDAPSVVKAIKRLKRSRNKLLARFEGIESTGEHFALLPIAWSWSLNYKEKKAFQKLESEQLQKKDNLYFVGESYGISANADNNIIESILRTCLIISEAS